MFSLLLASVGVWHPKDRFWCLRPLAEDEVHGVLRAHMHRHTSLRVLGGPLIWIRSSRPLRCPSGRRRRKSSCAEHLSETAPVKHMQTYLLQTHQTPQTYNSVMKCFDQMRRTHSLLWRWRPMGEGQRGTESHMRIAACFIMQGDGETAWLHSTAMWVQGLPSHRLRDHGVHSITPHSPYPQPHKDPTASRPGLWHHPLRETLTFSIYCIPLCVTGMGFCFYMACATGDPLYVHNPGVIIHSGLTDYITTLCLI